jgi:hypothetical protein
MPNGTFDTKEVEQESSCSADGRVADKLIVVEFG